MTKQQRVYRSTDVHGALGRNYAAGVFLLCKRSLLVRRFAVLIAAIAVILAIEAFEVSPLAAYPPPKPPGGAPSPQQVQRRIQEQQRKGDIHTWRKEIAALRHQIKMLREEEHLIIAQIKANYKAIIEGTKLDERGRAALRRMIAQEERQALALTKKEKEKKEIRATYDYLRRVLTGEIRLEKSVIERLQLQETAHVRLIQTLYKAAIMQRQAAILELEQLIRAASK